MHIMLKPLLYERKPTVFQVKYQTFKFDKYALGFLKDGLSKSSLVNSHDN